MAITGPRINLSPTRRETLLALLFTSILESSKPKTVSKTGIAALLSETKVESINLGRGVFVIFNAKPIMNA